MTCLGIRRQRRINVASLLVVTKTVVREESRKLNTPQETFYYFTGSNFFDIRAVPAELHRTTRTPDEPVAR